MEQCEKTSSVPRVLHIQNQVLEACRAAEVCDAEASFIHDLFDTSIHVESDRQDDEDFEPVVHEEEKDPYDLSGFEGIKYVNPDNFATFDSEL